MIRCLHQFFIISLLSGSCVFRRHTWEGSYVKSHTFVEIIVQWNKKWVVMNDFIHFGKNENVSSKNSMKQSYSI